MFLIIKKNFKNISMDFLIPKLGENIAVAELY
jgi:hypothetical protein